MPGFAKRGRPSAAAPPEKKGRGTRPDGAPILHPDIGTNESAHLVLDFQTEAAVGNVDAVIEAKAPRF